MKEIEILVEVYDDINLIKEKFKNFEYIGLKKTIDEYFYDPLREDLKPDKFGGLNHCLRLRQKNNEYSITYKDDIFENNKWIFSKEYETKLESIEMTKEIFNKLGLKKFIEINNEKEAYKYDKYEIVLESVKDLGIFMEVELCTNEDIDIKNEKNKIQEFINSLGINISEELNIGKPELYMKKHNIKIN